MKDRTDFPHAFRKSWFVVHWSCPFLNNGEWSAFPMIELSTWSCCLEIPQIDLIYPRSSMSNSVQIVDSIVGHSICSFFKLVGL